MIRRFLSLAIYFLFTLITVNAQNEWDSWNERYTEINFSGLISYEKSYSDSVNRGFIEGDYYCRMDKFRFSAIYLGERRKIADSSKFSMKRVFKLHGNRDFLSLFNDLKYEYLLRIGDCKYWFSLQPNLQEPFEEELKKDDNVYLYCLFLNEHSMDGVLINSFLISEFYKY